MAFDTGHLRPEQFAARFCVAIGVRLPYAEFAEIWCDIFAEQREVTGFRAAGDPSRHSRQVQSGRP